MRADRGVYSVYRKLFGICCAMIALALAQGCSTFTPNLEEPTVKLDSLQLAESTGLSQRFKIGLLLTNPNAVSLPVKGMSYTLSLNGFDLLSGANNQIPTLEAYSETPISIDASSDLVAAIRLINSLANRPQNNLNYEFAAKIDLQGFRLPINIKRDGTINLTQPTP